MMVVFAQSGVIAGGWGYVVAAYVATWLFIGGYAASLWLRSREER
jgi:CcmD family protein